MQKTILIQRDILGHIRYSIMELEKDTVVSRWGIIDGKEQVTSHTYDFINKGKANELNPEEAALADFERKRDKKIKEGYREVESLDGVSFDKVEVLDFDNPQTSFTVSKPIIKVSDKTLQYMLDKKEVLLQEKENGMCHWVVVDKNKTIKIFTRRLNDHTAKYPDIVKACEGLPPLSLFAIEFVVEHSNHHTGFKLLSQISKSDTVKGDLKEDQTKSHNLQLKNPVRGCVFHCIYLDGVETWKLPYETVRERLHELFCKREKGRTLFRPVELYFTNVEQIHNYLKKFEKSIEGLVAWKKDGMVEVSFDGKPKRRACWKIKTVKEMDVVAWKWTKGTGENQDKIGALHIGKYRDGILLDYGRVGSGIVDEMRNPDKWAFPCVIEIEYDYQEDTGKFKFPRFSKIHEDKIPEECIAEPGEATEAVEVKFNDMV